MIKTEEIMISSVLIIYASDAINHPKCNQSSEINGEAGI